MTDAQAREYAGIEVEQSFNPMDAAENKATEYPEEQEPDQVTRDAEAEAAAAPPPVKPPDKPVDDHDKRGKDESDEDYSERVKKRINKEVRKRKELEEENARLKAEIEGKAKPAGEDQEPPAPGPNAEDIDLSEVLPQPLSKEEINKKALEMVGAKPSEDAFDDFDKYNEALTDWKVDVRIAEARIAEEDKKRVEGESQSVKTFAERLAKGETLWDDYAKVITNPTVQITRPMIAAMQDCEKAAEIAYYLGKNPIEAAKIARMTPVQITREILKLEAKFIADPNSAPPPNRKAAGENDQEPETEDQDTDDIEPELDVDAEDEEPPAPPPPEKPQQKKISSAPAPIKPVATGSASGNKDPEKMSPAEYRKWREGGGGKG